MRHPVQSLLQHHSYSGTTPAADELAELKLDATATAAVKSAAAEARELHSSGERGKAHTLAFEKSVAIVGTLPQAQQDPRYLAPDPNEALEGLGPREMADLIPRR